METALAADAATAISLALTALKKDNMRSFAAAFRESKVYNNGTEGIDCEKEEVKPWFLGDAIIKKLKEV